MHNEMKPRISDTNMIFLCHKKIVQIKMTVDSRMSEELLYSHSVTNFYIPTHCQT